MLLATNLYRTFERACTTINELEAEAFVCLLL